MAFPENITSFVQAKDPTTSDIASINNYQSELSNLNFIGAKNILINMTNGIEMNMNAGRYNELIDTLKEIEEFYAEMGSVKQYIRDNIDAKLYVALYNANTHYKVGNLASNGSKWFKCKENCQGIEPEVSANWTAYWENFLEPQDNVQYPIQSMQPTNQNVGDLWFEVLEERN